MFLSLLGTILVLFLLWIALYWYLYVKELQDLSKNIDKLPTYPIIGTLLYALKVILTNDSVEDYYNYFISEVDKYGDSGILWLGFKPYAFLRNPLDIECILSNSAHNTKNVEYALFKPWIGDGLLISEGHKWKTHRKLIAPTFHQTVLKSFIKLFNTNSKEIVEKMSKEEGKIFDCHEYMAEATVNMLTETVMGVDKNIHKESSLGYAIAVMKVCEFLQLRQLKLWLRPDWIFKLSKIGKEQIKQIDIIHNWTSKIFEKKKVDYQAGIRWNTEDQTDSVEKKTIYEETLSIKDDLDEDVGSKKRAPFLEHLLGEALSNGEISEQEVREQVDTIMFEGHDTTAAASSFFLCLMGIHQDIQEKVYQELNGIFGDSDRDVTYADTLEMKYLERSLMETLRLYPPVPLISRKLTSTVKCASGSFQLPVGTTVVIPILLVHRHKDFYDNPNEFNPDNFLPEKASKRHYYSFVPFSAGPRSCVGRKYAILKLKILLSTILRNFRVVAEDKEKDFKLRGDIILKRSEGFNIRLVKRHK